METLRQNAMYDFINGEVERTRYSNDGGRPLTDVHCHMGTQIEKKTVVTVMELSKSPLGKSKCIEVSNNYPDSRSFNTVVFLSDTQYEALYETMKDFKRTKKDFLSKEVK